MHFLSIASIRAFTREDLKRIRSRERKRESERFAGIYSISIRVITTSLTLANGLVVSAYLTAERTRGLSCRGGWHMGTMAHAITMATSPTTDLSAISLLSFSFCLSLPLRFSFSLVLSARGARWLSVRLSVSPVACTDVCYPTFFAAGSLHPSLFPSRPTDRWRVHTSHSRSLGIGGIIRQC